jgi:hypothetical protein
VGGTVTPWTLTALVVRYGVEIDGMTLERGCFAHSLANWWVPLMADHRARYLCEGVACHYDDIDAGLVVDFVVDEWIAEQVCDGMRPEFSVGYASDAAECVTVAELHEVTLLRPPQRGACPGTYVLDVQPATADELECVRWAERTPNGVPVDDADRAAGIGAEMRARYGVRRDFDPLEFWTAEAARRERV